MRGTARFITKITILAASLAAASGVARASDRPTLTLAWDAPSECPRREEVEASVARLLEGSRATEALEADVRITVDRRGVYRARLRTRLDAARGERSLSAASCALVTSATALVLALTVDPTIEVEAPPPPSPASPPRVVDEPPPALVAAAEAPPPSPREPSPIGIALGASAVLDVGLLPSPAVGGEAEIAVAHRRVSFIASGAAFSPDHAGSDARPGAGGQFSLLAASLRACLGTGRSLSVGVCGGAELDRMHADGFGVTTLGQATRVWAAPRAGLRLEWRPTSLLSIPLTADVVVPLARPTFALENVGAVFRPAPAAARIVLGLVVHFR